MDVIQQLMREHLGALQASGQLQSWQSYAGWHISNCRTATLGGHVERCPSGLSGHHHKVYYNSCRHRSCPQCSARSRRQWLDSYVLRILPCAHRQVVFTVPHRFNALWLRNTRWFAKVLFDCAADALKRVSTDAKNLGAEAGFSLALHTWGRNLPVHPHVHALISAGGLDKAGRWVEPKHGTYLPAEVLMRLFRAGIASRLRAALRAGELDLPKDTDAGHWRQVVSGEYQKSWNVRVEKPYTHGDALAKYLAKYMKGGPIRSQQLRRLSGDKVRLCYKSHQTGQRAASQFSGQGFVKQLLIHSPPTGLHCVRHYGLYAGSKRRQLDQAFKQMGVKRREPEAIEAQETARACCEQCGRPIESMLLLASNANRAS